MSDGKAGSEEGSDQWMQLILTEYLGVFCWLFVIVAGVGYYLWTNKFKSAIANHQKIRYHQNAAANAKKNDSSEVLARSEQMLAARAKMQEEYNAKVELYVEKKKEQDEIKRQNDIIKLENKLTGTGRRLHGADSVDKTNRPKANDKRSTNKSSLRDNFNPLTGGGGMSSYRPNRRLGGARGGGG